MKGRLLPATKFATSNLDEVATQDTGTSVVEDDRAPSLVRGSIVDIRAAAGAAYIVIVASRAGDAGLGDGECSTSGEGAEAAAEITDLAGIGTLAGFETAHLGDFALYLVAGKMAASSCLGALSPFEMERLHILDQ